MMLKGISVIRLVAGIICGVGVCIVDTCCVGVCIDTTTRTASPEHWHFMTCDM